MTSAVQVFTLTFNFSVGLVALQLPNSFIRSSSACFDCCQLYISVHSGFTCLANGV